MSDGTSAEKKTKHEKGESIKSGKDLEKIETSKDPPSDTLPAFIPI